MQIEKYLWMTKPEPLVQQYVSQAYQTLQTIIKLILEAQVVQNWNMSIDMSWVTFETAEI